MKKRLLITVSVMVVMLILFTQTELGKQIRIGDIQQIAAKIQSYGWIAPLISILAIILQTFFPVIPFILLAGANVVVFGLWMGFAISWLAAVLAALANFFLARYTAREWAERKIGNHSYLTKLNKQAESKGFMIVLASRLIPVLPSSVVNTAAGVSKVSFQSFFFATIIGKVPAVFFESILGNYVFNWEGNKGKIVVMAIAIILFLYYINKVKKKRKLMTKKD